MIDLFMAFVLSAIAIFCLLFAFEFKIRSDLSVLTGILLLGIIYLVTAGCIYENSKVHRKIDDMLLISFCKTQQLNYVTEKESTVFYKRVKDYNNRILNEAKRDQSKLKLLIIEENK